MDPMLRPFLPGIFAAKTKHSKKQGPQNFRFAAPAFMGKGKETIGIKGSDYHAWPCVSARMSDSEAGR